MNTTQTNQQMRPAPRKWQFLLAALGISAVLVACGGGGGGGAGPASAVGSGGTGFSGPISGFGSVIVNGVRIDDNGASVTLDDDAGSSANLRLGMMVEIEGSRSADGLTGTANSIGSHSVAQGPIAGITGADQFNVLGLNVTVNAATVFAGVRGAPAVPVTSLATLLAGDIVEVHGIPNGPDGLIATRIESKPNAPETRLTGTVAALGASSFTLHGTVINFAGVAAASLPANLANGLTVRARGALTSAAGAVPATIAATRVQTRNQDHLKKSGQFVEIEGSVTTLTSTGDFVVNDTHVTVAAGAKVEGSVALNARVEIQGTVDASGNVLASKVEVKSASGKNSSGGGDVNELHGLATSVDVAGQTLVLRNVTVVWNAATQFKNALTPADLATVRVEVKGQVTGNTLLATSIERDQ